LLVLHNDNDIDYLQPLKPASARIFPVVRPIPEAAPVTGATLPETPIAYTIG
jgi:hypothetical protein|tara:strand:+ start:440 stop:595 length:156 start_codon:yes stop_codon:yes gene_type:complete